ncbi:inovirus Gp2 family protein [Castellaniella sp.]|uniref:inovirus Gp2 family protein n=1 Tax=Castellaniella sp. TaxID=1955812 RepID=UPI003C775C35
MLQNTYNLEYQDIIFKTIQKALEVHPRVMAVRIDLRFPMIETQAETESDVITRFFASIKAKIKADLKRKEKSWGRRVSCNVRYVWAREYGTINGRKHYHVLLLLNKDAYHLLGPYSSTKDTLSAIIKQAWCSATRLTHPDFLSLVNFGRVFYLNKNNADITQKTKEVMTHASYLAKNITKRYGDGERSIGSSF